MPADQLPGRQAGKHCLWKPGEQASHRAWKAINVSMEPCTGKPQMQTYVGKKPLNLNLYDRKSMKAFYQAGFGLEDHPVATYSR